MKRGLIACLLLSMGSLSVQAGQVLDMTDQSQPVLVRFGNLYWVGAKTALPQIVSGQVLVPPAETCDLLGLTCTIGKNSLSVNGQPLDLLPLKVSATQSVMLTPLTPLAKLAGQTVSWESQSKTATVSGGSGSQGWRSTLDYLGMPQKVYAGALRTYRTALELGNPTVKQSAISLLPLHDLTMFSKKPGSLNIVGSQAPGTPDVPNKWPGCQGQRLCALPVPRDALWVLALATTP